MLHLSGHWQLSELTASLQRFASRFSLASLVDHYGRLLPLSTHKHVPRLQVVAQPLGRRCSVFMKLSDCLLPPYRSGTQKLDTKNLLAISQSADTLYPALVHVLTALGYVVYE